MVPGGPGHRFVQNLNRCPALVGFAGFGRRRGSGRSGSWEPVPGEHHAESSLPGDTSGVPGSPYYVNLLPAWLTNDTFTWTS
jgi:hypothetical protein